MKRFIAGLMALTAVGLGMVYGEVEAVKLGYQIRHLQIKKLELENHLKWLEVEVASLKTPHRLEQWMDRSHVKLTEPNRVQMVQAVSQSMRTSGPRRNGSKADSLGRLFLGTAQASPER